MTVLHAEQLPFSTKPYKPRTPHVTPEHPTKRRRIHINANERSFIDELCRRAYTRAGQAGGERG